MPRFFFTLLCYLLGLSLTIAQPAEKSVIRKPNQELWQDIKTSRDYSYNPPTTVDQGQSLLATLWYRFLNWISSLLYEPEFSTERMWFQVIFVVAVLAFLCYKLWQMDKNGVFGRKAKQMDLPYDILEEDIHAISFDDAIRTALENANYRLATRLYYLRTLKILSDDNLINWQINKTNATYLQELKESKYISDFEQLTKHFNYVWYGNFSLSEGHFQTIQNQFRGFQNQFPKP